MRNWENIYKNYLHISKWPWSDLVTLVNKYSEYKLNNKLNILEIGTGLGANISFIINNNHNYYGNEESTTAYNFLKKKFKKKNVKITNCNFLDINYKNNFFDNIIDRASITHNSYNDIKKIYTKSYNILNPKGTLISTYLFSKKCSIFQNNYSKSTNTVKNIKTGFLKDVGLVSFFEEKDIYSLIPKKFSVIHLEHNHKKIFKPYREDISWWNLILKKNEL